jgi:hypothetical protein
MGDDYFSFLGWYRSTQRIELTKVDAAAEASGLIPMGPCTRLPNCHEYEVGIDLPFSVAVNEESIFSQFSVFGVTARHCQHRDPDTFATLTTAIAQSCDAILVRSFHPSVSEALVQGDELGGDVKHLDWYQYWGPTIVARWGLERLRQGPFYRVESQPTGACVIWMGPHPFRERISVKAAVEYLGIQSRLRPLS